MAKLVAVQYCFLCFSLLSAGCELHPSDRFVQNYAAGTHLVEAGTTDGRVTSLKLEGISHAKQLSTHLNKLAHLRVVRYANLTLTMNDLNSLLVLPVERLELINCDLKEANFEKIAQMQEVNFLDVFGSDINDVELTHLRKMPELRELKASGSHVTGTCFGEGFRHLEKLWLTSCPVSDEGLEAISKLRSLKFLDISKSEVSIAGAMHLAKTHALETVWGPKSLTAEEKAAIWYAHVREKRKARNNGIAVPVDELSPFKEFEQQAIRELISARNKLRDCQWSVSTKTGKVEKAIVLLLGRETGMSVLEQVDGAHANLAEATDYTQTDRSLLDIFENDFDVSFDGDPIGVLPPNEWHKSPNIGDMDKFNQAIRVYLSGRCPGVPLHAR